MRPIGKISPCDYLKESDAYFTQKVSGLDAAPRADETSGVTETEDTSTWQRIKWQITTELAQKFAREARECAAQPMKEACQQSSGIGGFGSMSQPNWHVTAPRKPVSSPIVPSPAHTSCCLSPLSSQIPGDEIRLALHPCYLIPSTPTSTSAKRSNSDRAIQSTAS